MMMIMMMMDKDLSIEGYRQASLYLQIHPGEAG